MVSVLNELIVIKSELGILVDKTSRRLKDYEIVVDNDELIISDENGIFEYNYLNRESQRVQETIFIERQTIIENCLFGVDINPNSVKICRLRLWIELLKSSYYKAPDYLELETLPNIDINIKCGNSLISRYSLDADLKKALQKSKWNITSYRLAVMTYRNAKSKDEKREMERLIDEIKNNFESEIQSNDKRFKKLRDLKGELFTLTNQGVLFDKTKKQKAAWNKKVEKLTSDIKNQEQVIEDIRNNVIYKNAFEWRFEFPDVLNNDGEFEGFDIVIGNPPYIKEDANRNAFDGLRKNECYQGKMDIWYLFGDLGLKLLKPDYYLCFIATNNWVTNAGASNFRNIVIKHSQLINLIDFGAHMIFENASIQTMIMLFKNNKIVDNYTFEYRKLEGAKPTRTNVLNLLSSIKSADCIFLQPLIIKEHLISKTLTFNSDSNSELLLKIKSKQNFFLIDKNDKDLGLQSEVASGIDVLQDFVSNKNVLKLEGNANVGDGVFVLNNNELENLKLIEKEKEIIKPYFTTEQLQKYYGNSQNQYWIIYTKSDIGKLNEETNTTPIDDFPQIKNHLDKYKNIITSDNKPYGLHRAREQYLFEGEKIFALRKCPTEPRFTYTDFDCYVSRAFLVIQSDRINLKYLTGLLNSKLIAFWLRKKGKMQGNSYQIDKEPVVEIPIYIPSEKEANEIINLVDKILLAKQQGKNSADEEREIDKLVYKLYDISLKEQKLIEV